MITFFDSKSERGGGQVVLEHLLELTQSQAPTSLVMPRAGQSKITIPDAIASFDTSDEYIARSHDDVHVLVSNANSAMPDVVSTAGKLRRAGKSVTTVSIIHNYPSKFSYRAATSYFVRRFDKSIVVEPGLLRLCKSAMVPSWLSLYAPLSTTAEHQSQGIKRTGKVKSYGRPDHEKGLHHLAPIFAAISETGTSCQVALGSGFAGNGRYANGLRRDLAPWLVEGRRTSEWIKPGDIFVIPSLTEAACLTAQEALSRGAFVIATRVGLMTYLSPTNQGVRTFAVGDVGGAIRMIDEALNLNENEFEIECFAGVSTIEERAGRWHHQTAAAILKEHASAYR